MVDVLPLCKDYSALTETIHIPIEPEHVSGLLYVPLAIDIYLIAVYYIEHRLFPLGVPPLILGSYFVTPNKYRRRTPVDQPFFETDP